MKNKKNLIILLICVIVLTVVCISITIFMKTVNNSIAFEPDTFYNGIPVYYSHGQYAFDTSTPERAIGCSDYTVVVKVNNIVKTEYRDPVEIELTADGKKTKTVYDPYTIYDIMVIENIKGKLTQKNNIQIEQMGGLTQDNERYTFMEGVSPLKVGQYYILMPNAIDNKGPLEVSIPTDIVALGDTLESERAKELINRYKEAYKNEIVPNKETDGVVKEFFKSEYDVMYE